MPKKVDPLNKKHISAVATMLTVRDIKAAVAFYQKAFGLKKIAVMSGPDGKPMHAEMRLRDTVLMLGPEMPQWGSKGAQTLGGTPVTLYVMTDNTDKMYARAVKAGGQGVQPPADMFWGDRCGTVVDPEGNKWMIATHYADFTPAEMRKKRDEFFATMAAGAGGAS